MRERVFTNESDTGYTGSEYSESGNIYYLSSDYEYGRNDVFHDIVTAEFEKKRNQGDLVFNAMGRATQSLSCISAPTIAISGYNNYGVVGGIWPVDTVSPSSQTLTFAEIQQVFGESRFDGLRDIAVAKAWANVDETELLLMASIGELPETIAWMAKLLRRGIALARILVGKEAKVHALKALRKVKPSDAAKQIADLWLEFRYAVRPLVFEMENAVRALEKSISENERHTARGFVKSEDISITDAELTALPYATYTQRTKTSYKYEARAGCLYSVSGAIDGLSLTLGLGSPFETIWELVPFSFILDWFFNVGDIISAWEKNASLVILGTWVTETLIETSDIDAIDVTHQWNSIGYNGVSMSVSNPGTKRVVRTVQLRTIDPSRPIIPSVKVNLNVAKLSDLAAIAWSILGGSSRKGLRI